jgi:hypothetical protein
MVPDPDPDGPAVKQSPDVDWKKIPEKETFPADPLPDAENV